MPGASGETSVDASDGSVMRVRAPQAACVRSAVAIRERRGDMAKTSARIFSRDRRVSQRPVADVVRAA